MASILFVTDRIYGKQFKCNYLRKIFFSDFVAAFLNSTSSFEHFEYKDDLESLWTSQNRGWERRG